MGRILAIVLTFIMVGYVLIAIVATNKGDIATTTPSAQSAAALGAINTIPENFNVTGTLVFYPNNVGPVPYIFYQDQSGHTVAKALVFSMLLPTGFSSWSGARVFVTGQLDNEHVAVNSITYIAAP